MALREDVDETAEEQEPPGSEPDDEESGTLRHAAAARERIEAPSATE